MGVVGRKQPADQMLKNLVPKPQHELYPVNKRGLLSKARVCHSDVEGRQIQEGCS